MPLIGQSENCARIKAINLSFLLLGNLVWPRGTSRGTLKGTQGVKGVLGGLGKRLRYPMGSTATFDMFYDEWQ